MQPAKQRRLLNATLGKREMTSIPDGLLEQVVRSNALLFIGEHLVRNDQGQSEINQFTRELAAQSTLEDGASYTFPEVAQIYEDEHGRHALVQAVLDHIEERGVDPLDVHRLIAGLTDCRVLVSTCLDRRLERAFEAIDRPIDVITGNIDLAFEDERKVQLYKLRGSLDQLDSLVLTEDDYEIFFDDQDSISVVLQGYIVRKTILFLGYNLADPHFKRLYRKVTSSLDKYARRAYGFGENLDAKTASWCKRHGIEVLETRTSDFLSALSQQAAARARPQPAVQSHPTEPALARIPDRPYKLLDFYDSKDEAIFFGREREIRHLTSIIHAHRLVLLYGASGVGKTSLLQAGVLPGLERADPPYETLTVRALEDPLQILRNTIRRRWPDIEIAADSSLAIMLDSVTKARGMPVVLVLDQFEEFFLRFGTKIRAQFIHELAGLYEAQDVPVKLVISLREDWLASMTEVEARIPETFRTKLRLLPLSRNQAYTAIMAPVERLGMQYDQNLVDRLFQDLIEEQGDGFAGQDSESILPPHLQLICDALYQRAKSQNNQRITMATYEAVGRIEGILGRHLHSALQEHPAAEREIAQGVLMALVTSQDTKAWSSMDALAVEVGGDDATVDQVLARLTSQRLIRRLEDGSIYELAHDILAQTISNWISEEGRQLKQVRELLHRELLDWQRDPAVLLSSSKFDRINDAREFLSLSEEEKTYLLRAALLYGKDIPYWLDQVKDRAQQTDILLELLRKKNIRARSNAVIYLAGFPEDQVAEALVQTALHDPQPDIRNLASTRLGRMKNRVGIQQLIRTLSAQDAPADSRAALHALAHIWDVAPDRLKDLKGADRRRIMQELARIRFWRNWPRNRLVVAVGALGGAIAFGLGLTLPVALNDVGIYGVSVGESVLFYGFILSILGLLAGAGMALGISLGSTLLRERDRLGRILGGSLIGGLFFAFALFLLIFGRITQQPEIILGSLSFGLLVGLGITVPAVVSSGRVPTLIGAIIGATSGILVFGALGSAPFQVAEETYVPRILVLASGAIVGLAMAGFITWAEKRWPIHKGDPSLADSATRA